MRDNEGKTAVVIPLVVRPVVIGVEPTTIVIAVRVEQVRVAVGNAHFFICATALRILSGLYSMRD